MAPSEYYYHRMKNARELDPLAEYIECRFQATMDVSMCFRVSYDPENAQAIHIIIGGGMDTDDPFGGYAIEISLPDWFYQTENAEINDTDGINITIPKKKGKSIQTIGGNLIFFLERKILAVAVHLSQWSCVMQTLEAPCRFVLSYASTCWHNALARCPNASAFCRYSSLQCASF
ncbi:hypothetical protein Tco_0572291 [Tanacetum coccineum]